MNGYHLRVLTYLSSFVIIVLLALFSGLKENITISIGLILVFLILFTYIFKIEGFERLKLMIIIFTFIGLPLLLLFYLNPLHGIWQEMLAVIVVLVSGIASVITIIRLNYVELVW